MITTKKTASSEGGVLKSAELRFRHIRFGIGWVVKWSPSIKMFFFKAAKTINGTVFEFHIWRLRLGFAVRS